MDSLPIGNLFNPFRGPLTAQDIERIEEGMNLLINDLFKNNPNALAHELQKDLPYKIQGYVNMAALLEKNPEVDIDPLFGERLRALLKLVKAYYHQLN